MLCAVGIPDVFSPSPFLLSAGRRILARLGGRRTREIRELLAFCAAHDIVAEVEVIGKVEFNQALDRLRRNEVRFRFVIDLSRDRELLPERVMVARVHDLKQ